MSKSAANSWKQSEIPENHYENNGTDIFKDFLWWLLRQGNRMDDPGLEYVQTGSGDQPSHYLTVFLVTFNEDADWIHVLQDKDQ